MINIPIDKNINYDKIINRLTNKDKPILYTLLNYPLEIKSVQKYLDINYSDVEIL